LEWPEKSEYAGLERLARIWLWKPVVVSHHMLLVVKANNKFYDPATDVGFENVKIKA